MKSLTLILLLAIIAGCATEAEYGLREDAKFNKWITSSPDKN